MSPTLLIAFAAAGALGAVSRYLLDFAITAHARGGPWGTLTVNLTGSFASGLLVGLVLFQEVPESYRVVVGGGFLGAYTTFSTWMYETVRLLEARRWRAASFHTLVGPLLGVLSTALGFALAWWLAS